MNITRYLHKAISVDLQEKMVFIGGPRQVGKTTISKEFITTKDQYLNWDNLDDRSLLKSHKVNPNLKTVILDEIHKFKLWRTLVKGLFDKFGDGLKILVTGSARLDHFRKGGDSLFGRFHYYRLHPLSVSELDKDFKPTTVQRLLKYGGFPEPYLKNNERFYRRWHKTRLSRVVNQDIRDLSTIKELSMIELLVDLLPSRVGSILSIKSLQEDLMVSPNTVSAWIQVLENVYYCFRILPYGPPKIRAVKKSNKLYLWDWAAIENSGAKFENLVASQLLKYCHFIEDTEGYTMELRFVRDVDLREIDFVVLKDKKPIFAVECKTGESNISKHIYYFRDRIPVPIFYQVHLGTNTYKDGNVLVLPFNEFCKKLKMP